MQYAYVSTNVHNDTVTYTHVQGTIHECTQLHTTYIAHTVYIFMKKWKKKGKSGNYESC